MVGGKIVNMRILILLFLLTISPNLYAFCKDVQCTDYFNAVQKKILELYEPWDSEHGVTGYFRFISLELKHINDDDTKDIIIKYGLPGHNYDNVEIYIVKRKKDELELSKVFSSSFYPNFRNFPYDERMDITNGYQDFKFEMYFEDYICKFNDNKFKYMCYRITNHTEENLVKCVDSEIDLTYYDNSC